MNRNAATKLLAEKLTDQAARVHRFECRRARRHHLHERGRDKRHQEIAREPRWSDEAVLAANERNAEQQKLQRQRPRDDADRLHERAGDRGSDRTHGVVLA